jgi:hypothetical protein
MPCCSNCGKETGPEDAYCYYCGAAVSQAIPLSTPLVTINEKKTPSFVNWASICTGILFLILAIRGIDILDFCGNRCPVSAYIEGYTFIFLSILCIIAAILLWKSKKIGGYLSVIIFIYILYNITGSLFRWNSSNNRYFNLLIITIIALIISLISLILIYRRWNLLK